MENYINGKLFDKNMKFCILVVHDLTNIIWQAKVDKNGVFSNITYSLSNITNSFSNITNSITNISNSFINITNSFSNINN